MKTIIFVFIYFITQSNCMGYFRGYYGSSSVTNPPAENTNTGGYFSGISSAVSSATYVGQRAVEVSMYPFSLVGSVASTAVTTAGTVASYVLPTNWYTAKEFVLPTAMANELRTYDLGILKQIGSLLQFINLNSYKPQNCINKDGNPYFIVCEYSMSSLGITSANFLSGKVELNVHLPDSDSKRLPGAFTTKNDSPLNGKKTTIEVRLCLVVAGHEKCITHFLQPKGSTPPINIELLYGLKASVKTKLSEENFCIKIDFDTTISFFMFELFTIFYNGAYFNLNNKTFQKPTDYGFERSNFVGKINNNIQNLIMMQQFGTALYNNGKQFMNVPKTTEVEKK